MNKLYRSISRYNAATIITYKFYCSLNTIFIGARVQNEINAFLSNTDFECIRFRFHRRVNCQTM